VPELVGNVLGVVGGIFQDHVAVGIFGIADHQREATLAVGCERLGISWQCQNTGKHQSGNDSHELPADVQKN
jgi:hypothetical protein